MCLNKLFTTRLPEKLHETHFTDQKSDRLGKGTLSSPAVIFEGQNDGEIRHDEGGVTDGNNGVLQTENIPN